MKPSDLRIGNLVLLLDGTYYDAHTWTVSDIGKTGVALESNIGYVSPDFKNVYPIPITEEILTACGFKKQRLIGDRYYWFNGEFVLTDKMELAESDRYYDYLPANYSIGFDYLHQLQNVYFAITGIELDVNIDGLDRANNTRTIRQH